jgi:hypothetical protein
MADVQISKRAVGNDETWTAADPAVAAARAGLIALGVPPTNADEISRATAELEGVRPEPAHHGIE